MLSAAYPQHKELWLCQQAKTTPFASGLYLPCKLLHLLRLRLPLVWQSTRVIQMLSRMLQQVPVEVPFAVELGMATYISGEQVNCCAQYCQCSQLHLTNVAQSLLQASDACCCTTLPAYSCFHICWCSAVIVCYPFVTARSVVLQQLQGTS